MLIILKSFVKDPKFTLKIFSNLLRSNVDRLNVELKKNDDIISDTLKVSKMFNDYFSSIANTFEKKYSALFVKSMRENVNHSFKSKKFRLNEIRTYAFKYIVEKVVPMLTSLFNESTSNDVLPACLKIARAVPSHNSGSKTDVKYYRPISTLPFIRKLFEQLIH